MIHIIVIDEFNLLIRVWSVPHTKRMTTTSKEDVGVTGGLVGAIEIIGRPGSGREDEVDLPAMVTYDRDVLRALMNAPR